MGIPSKRFLCFLLLLLFPAALQGNAPVQWHWRNPLPQGNYLYSVAHGNGMFVAVGDWGTFVVSPDGTNWNYLPAGETDDMFFDLVYANGSFVAAGADVILTSNDGLQWDRQNVNGYLTAVAYGNGVFVAAGNDNVFRSSDGSTWTEHPFDIEGYDHPSLTFGAGQFSLAIGDKILRSTDGITWVEATFPGLKFSTIIHANNQVFAFGYSVSDGKPRVVSSEDGVEWVVRASNGPFFISDVVYDGQRLVAVGDQPNIFVSSDGSSWSSEPAIDLGYFSGITYADGKFVAVGYAGHIVTSEDRYSWSERTPGFRSNLEKVVFGNDRFVATDGQHMLVSTNGSNWTHGAPLTDFLSQPHLVYGNGTFVAASGIGQAKIFSSTNGIEWTRSEKIGFLGGIVGLQFGRKKFVAVGDQIATSTDGKSWVARQKPPNVSIKSLAIGKGRFVAGCRAGKIITSEDGISWTVKNLGVTNDLAWVSFEDGNFRITLDPQSFIPQGFTSSDGLNWKKTTSPPLSPVGIIKGSTGYAGFESHRLAFSYDGDTWSYDRIPRVNVIQSIAFGKNTFVAVGFGGAILQSDPMPDCSGSISPRVIQLDYKGGEVNVDVVAANDCAWSLWNKHEWVTVNSASNGMGNSTVSISVLPNDSTDRRTAVLPLAGQNFVISQDPKFAPWSINGKTLLLNFNDGSAIWHLHMRGRSGISYPNVAHIRVRGKSGTRVESYQYSSIDSESAFLAWDGLQGTLSFIDRRNGNFAFTNAQNTVHTGTFELFTSEPSYNEDGIPSILWHADNQAVATWDMEGTNFLSSTTLHRGATGVGWRVAGSADVNADGFADIVWQHQDGRIATWGMTGATRDQSPVYPFQAVPSARVVAVGDIFGDTFPDFLLQEDTGQLWAMNGFSINSYSVFPQRIAGRKTAPGRVVGMRDFNHDGRSDILFQNAAGRLSIWYLDGVHLISEEEWPYNIPAHRRVAALVDLDQNGTSDLIFRSQTASVGVWFMDGKTHIGSAALRKGRVPGSQWRLIGPK